MNGNPPFVAFWYCVRRSCVAIQEIAAVVEPEMGAEIAAGF